MILDINIPNQAPISFKSSMFSNDNHISTSGFSEYPFFSSEIIYPKEQLRELSYQEQLDFFFKKSKFLERLKETDEYTAKADEFVKRKKEMDDAYKKYIKDKDTNATTAFEKYSEIVKKNNVKNIDLNKNNICRKNIMLMLLLLFPVKTYETTNNTYEHMFLNSFSSTFSISGIMPILMSVFMGIKDESEKYSYLTLPGKGTCTITHIVWTNDIYNHPEYKNLTQYYNKYNEWKINELIKQSSELEKKFQNFKTKYTTMLSDMGGYKYKEQRSGYQTNMVQEINKLIQNAKALSTATNFKSYIYKTSKIFISSFKFLSNMQNIIESIEQYVLEQSGLENFNLRQLVRDLEEVLKLYEIIDYINNQTVDDDNDTNKNKGSKQQREIEDRKQRLSQWSGNQEINKFMEIVKQVKNQETSNLLLKTSIHRFIKLPDPEGMPKSEKIPTLEQLMIPENSQSTENLKCIDTGVSLPVKSNATIYLQVDVIEGKVDDANKSKITCIFNKEYLGNELEELLKPTQKFWELKNNRFYFNMNTETAKILDENKKVLTESANTNNNEDVSKKINKDKGNTRTKKNRKIQ